MESHVSPSPYIDLGATPEERRLLDTRGEEIIGFGMVALTNTFSKRQAIRRIEKFGLSRPTSTAMVDYIESDPALREELAERLLGRARLAGIGCAAALVLALIPSIPQIYAKVMAVSSVYCVFSIFAWRRYSKPITR